MVNINLAEIIDEQSQRRQLMAKQLGVLPEISPDDMLFDFLLRKFSGNAGCR